MIFQSIPLFFQCVEDSNTPGNWGYPIGYLDARARIRPSSFLETFDAQVAKVRPGLITWVLTATVIPIGILLRLYYWYARNELYNDLITITYDNNRLEVVQNQRVLNAINHDVINIHDLVCWPRDALVLIINPDVLQKLTHDSDCINYARKQIKQKISSLRAQADDVIKSGESDSAIQISITAAYRELNQLSSLLERIRDSNYSSEVIYRLFQDELHSQNAPPIMAQAYITNITSISSSNEPIPEATVCEPNDLQDDNVVQHSFLINLLAHPVTNYTSIALSLAGLLLLGSITMMGALPLTACSIVVSSTILATGIGLFTASAVTASLFNAEPQYNNPAPL